MPSLWTLYLLLSFSSSLSPHVTVVTGESDEEALQPASGTAMPGLTQTSPGPPGSGSAAESPIFGAENLDFLPLNWSLSSPEEPSEHRLNGEYTDVLEGVDASALNSNEWGLTRPRPTEKASPEENTQPQPTQQTLKDQSVEPWTGSLLRSTQTGAMKPTFPAWQNKTADSRLPSLLSDSLSSDSEFTSPLPAGPGPSPEQLTPPIPTGSWGRTTVPSVITQGKTQDESVPVLQTKSGATQSTDLILHRGAVNVEEDKGEIQ